MLGLLLLSGSEAGVGQTFNSLSSLCLLTVLPVYLSLFLTLLPSPTLISFYLCCVWFQVQQQASDRPLNSFLSLLLLTVLPVYLSLFLTLLPSLNCDIFLTVFCF